MKTLTVYVVKYCSDPYHSKEFDIDFIYEDEEMAKLRMKEIKKKYPYDVWISEEYVILKES